MTRYALARISNIARCGEAKLESFRMHDDEAVTVSSTSCDTAGRHLPYGHRLIRVAICSGGYGIFVKREREVRTNSMRVRVHARCVMHGIVCVHMLRACVRATRGALRCRLTRVPVNGTIVILVFPEEM